jgi:hydrogenase maturation protease
VVTSLPSLLVIGLGRHGHGDDAAGLLAVERLRSLAPPWAAMAAHGGEMTALIDLWQGHGAVVLIDATDLGAPAGTLSRFEGVSEPIATRHLAAPPPDQRSATVFELAQALGRLPKRLTVLGVEGSHFAPDSPPSPELIAALDGTVERLLAEIGTLGTAAAGRLKGS